MLAVPEPRFIAPVMMPAPMFTTLLPLPSRTSPMMLGAWGVVVVVVVLPSVEVTTVEIGAAGGVLNHRAGDGGRGGGAVGVGPHGGDQLRRLRHVDGDAADVVVQVQRGQ